MVFFSAIALAILGYGLGGALGKPVLENRAVQKKSFTSELMPNVGLRFVKNSGVCETTPGVEQLSGYIDIGTNMSTWFWFFEARHQPETAPFTLWINGGPGCSSMIGLFQEHGPCNVNPDGKTTTLNPFSWNTISNMIYIDQPIGTGFSHGTTTVNSTETAAPFFWQAFQILFESGEFSKFQKREFLFTTESYGGHYGPAFVTYFNQQNEKIRRGEIRGEIIDVSALMINNGWYDALIQYPAYAEFAANAPGYGQLQNDSVIKSMNDAVSRPGGCIDQEQACRAAGNSTRSNEICINASNFCTINVEIPAVGDRDVNDLRQKDDSPNPFPPPFYLNFLGNETIKQRIGAESNYSECSNTVGQRFGLTGDDSRSLLPSLAALVNEKMKILIWAGDADINCNWVGGHTCVSTMDWYGKERFAKTPFTNMTINGKPVAAIQNLDNFSFARVYEAGHEVPAFQPEASLEIFRQIIAREQLHSV
ncbi:alpha/beta-hydrolase [Marasmius fiardii PR-910]|nr:alpha/beta-hydrolase [Marasmius fiardii PR-910]